MKRMTEVTAGFEERGDEEKVTLVLDDGCRNLKTEKAIECTWRKRFCSLEQIATVGSIGVPSSPLTL